MRTRIIAISVAVFIVMVVVVGLAVSRPTVQVLSATASTGTISRQILASGTLEPVRMVEVGAQVSGRVVDLPVDFNSTVKAGEVIAKLDPSVYASQLQEARAEVDQARAEAAQAQNLLDDARLKDRRAEELAAQGLIDQADLDAAQVTLREAAADLKGRQADIQSASADVKSAQVDLERTVIRSPIDGIVVNRNVDTGQTIAVTLQSPTLFTIADVRKMQLLTEVDESEIGGVQAGSTVSFQVESLGSQTFHGTVSAVRLQPCAEPVSTVVGGAAAAVGTSGNSGSNMAPTAGAGGAGSGADSAAPGAVTYMAVVDVDNADGRLIPGATAIVTTNGASRRDVVRLPNTALAFRPTPEMLQRTGQGDLPVTVSGNGAAGSTRISQVWRFENNKFLPLDVVTGLSDDRWTELISGDVKSGDQLITSAAAKH